MGYTLQFGQVAGRIPYLLGGALVSLELALISFGVGAAVGLVCAYLRLHGGRVASACAGLYAGLFTNTPAFVVLYFLFNGLPDAGILLPPFAAAATGLTLVAGAYLTEIMRSGFTSVRQAEVDTAEVLGMSRLQVVRYVVLPHLLHTLYPPLAGFFISLVLGSSLAALIGVEELTGRAINVSSETLRSIEVFLIVAVIYAALTLVASVLLAAVGRWGVRARMGLI